MKNRSIMDMRNPLCVLLFLSASSHSLPPTSKNKRQPNSGHPIAKENVKDLSIPVRVRGLSRQLNIFGDDDQLATPRNNFEARRKMSAGRIKSKGKYENDSGDHPMGIGLLPYENSEDNSAIVPEMPPLEIPENSAQAPESEMLPLDMNENSAPGFELPPLEMHENSAPGLELPPLENENSAPGFELPPFADSADMPTTGPQIDPTQAPNDYWSTQAPQPSPSSENRCQADSNGDYGSKDGDETVVNFLYQMELFPGITIQEGIMQIEDALISLLIPELFPEECGSQSSRRRLQNGEYIGVSSSPPDEPVNGCKL